MNVQPDPHKIPASTGTNDDWSDWDHNYRLVWGERRPVQATNLAIMTCSAQLPNGSFDAAGEVAEPPAIFIDEIRDGRNCDCLTVTVAGARELAQALIAAANEIDILVDAPSRPGDDR